MHALRVVGLVLLTLTLPVTPAQAQNEIETFVMVPDGPPGGALVAGCFRADRQLFGYRFTMCLRNRGTFEVRSGRRTCEGRLDWRARGRDITVDIRRTSCGRGDAWAAATIECRATSIVTGILDRIFGGGISPFVMVPDTPAVRTLRCTYFPTVRGVRPVDFTARRI